MKKIFDSIRGQLSLAAMAVFLLSCVLSSCTGDKTDIRELLATIPADASGVAAVNVKSIVEKAGCKIEGSKIVPGKEIEGLISAQERDDAAKIKAVLSGETGIDPSAMVFFIEGTDQYITGYLADPEKFKAYVKDNIGGEPVTEKGIEKYGNIAVKANQFWVRSSHRNDIDLEQIDRFLSLSEKLSFLSNSYASRLAEINHDVEGWGNITSLSTASQMSFQERTLAGLAVAMLFTDARDLSFQVDFENGKAISSMTVLNSKGDPAKFNLPVERIDPAMIKDLGGTANLYLGFALSPKFVEQVKKQLGDKNIPGGDEVFEWLSSIDGTCVAAIGENGQKGTVSTNGSNMGSLSDFLTEAMKSTVVKDGKLLRFSAGEADGTLSAEAAASHFKGAMIGAMISGDMVAKAFSNPLPVQSVFAALMPSKGSMEVVSEVNSGNEKENIILSFLKATQ